MKTLYESILDDIDVQMSKGDKIVKNFTAVQSDLKYIDDCINNFDPNSARPSKWYLWRDDYRVRSTIFFKTSKLTKHFNLPGKHIFIAVTFNKFHHTWDVNVIFSNASKTTIDNRQRQLERIGSIQGSVSYNFEEKNIPTDKASKFRMDEFIQTYVSPMFNDFESFKQYIVEPYVNDIRPEKKTI